MKKIMLLLSIISTSAFAELPPPGTARKGKITVEPNNKGDVFEYDLEYQKVVNRQTARAFNLRVKKEVEAMKKKVRDLEAENNRLKSRELPMLVSKPRTVERTVEVDRKTIAPFTIFGGVGAMPDGVLIEGENTTRKAQIHEFGTALQFGGIYHFENGLNIGANGAVATRDTHTQAYFGTLGYSFGSR